MAREPAEIRLRRSEDERETGNARRSARSRGLAEAHELALFLVPERQPHALEAGPERQPLGAAQLRVLFEAGAQAIVRNFAREVMDVMEADRGGEPVQEIR